MLAGTDLRECHFSGAVLWEADLSRTWLEEADFSGADHAILEATCVESPKRPCSRRVLQADGTSLTRSEVVLQYC